MPDLSTTHVDQVLTNFSIKYRNASFIADLVCPIVPVSKRSDKYLIFGKENFTIPNMLRAPRTISSTAEWSVSSDTYACDEWALNALLDDEEISNADAAVDIERSTVEYLTDMILLGREKRVADIMTSAVTFDSAEPDPNWNEADCTPIDDVMAAKAVVRAAIGREPNVMILPKAVLSSLKTCEQIIDLVKYSDLGRVTLDLLKMVFEIDQIYVPDAMYNSAEEGDTEALVDVWGDTVGLYYQQPGSGPRQISAAKTFRSRGFEVRRARIDIQHSNWYEPSMVEDVKVTSADAGYLLTNCNA